MLFSISPHGIDERWVLFFSGIIALLSLGMMLATLWGRSRRLRKWIYFIALGTMVICIVVAIIVLPHLPPADWWCLPAG